MTFTPSMEEVISQAIEDRLLDLHTSIPAIIESYDPVLQTASVKIALKRKYIVGDKEEIIERPVIPDIPILFPKGGNFHLTYPIKKGDDVQLIFSERSTERWKNESGIVDPKDARKFSLSDAFIIPVSGRKPSSGVAADKTRLVNDKAEIELNENGEIIVKSDGQRVFVKNSVASIELQAGGLVQIKNQTATVDMNPSGLIELKNASGKIRITDSGKFKIEGSKELLTIIDQFIDAMNSAQVLTALGLQPFFPPTPATLTQIKNDLLAIKE